MLPWPWSWVHSLAAAAFDTSKLLPERGLGVAPPRQQQQQLPPGPGPPQPVRTLPDLVTALPASLDRLWLHNVMTLHKSWTVQEVIAAEARLLESVHNSPADWVLLLATRFSLQAEQLRQCTSPAVRSPLSLTVVKVEALSSSSTCFQQHCATSLRHRMVG